MHVVLTVCIPGAYCPLACNTNAVTSTSSVTSAELHLAFPKILLSVWFQEETVQEKKEIWKLVTTQLCFEGHGRAQGAVPAPVDFWLGQHPGLLLLV